MKTLNLSMKVAGATLGIVVVGAVIGVLTGNLAFGHANLVESNVKNGQVFSVDDAPSQIKLKFSEHLSKRSTLYVVKLGEDVIADKGDLVIEEETMTISVSASKTGVYQIRWIAVDEEEAGFREGVITFSVKQ